MATLVIRNVENSLHARLKELAASRGHSMEEEVRFILRQSVARAAMEAPQGFGQAMRAIFEPLGGIEFPEIPPEPPREPPDFSGPDWDSPA
ncbi:MAG: plasmid stabilization protein [Rhodospirillales bacterium]|nr:plasmid stabilization protein [Rhodospirillales bacterium]